MVASVVEVSTPGAGSGTYQLSATPQAGDIYVAMIAEGATDEIASISGNGATWSRVARWTPTGTNALHKSHEIWVGRGPTSAGLVTVTRTSGYNSLGNTHILLVRGTDGTVATTTGAYTTAVTASGPAASVGPGQVVIDVANTAGGTLTIATTPAAGWSAKDQASTSVGPAYLRHRAPAAAETHQTTASAGTNGYGKRIFRATVGTAEGGGGDPDPPPAMRGMKIDVGGTWVEYPVKVHNGTSWVQRPVRVHNGTAWS